MVVFIYSDDFTLNEQAQTRIEAWGLEPLYPTVASHGHIEEEYLVPAYPDPVFPDTSILDNPYYDWGNPYETNPDSTHRGH